MDKLPDKFRLSHADIGAQMQRTANQLNGIFAQVNAQLGKLDEHGNVIVAYVVSGFHVKPTKQPQLGLEATMVTQAPRCKKLMDPLDPKKPQAFCGRPAAWAREGAGYFCDDHMQEGDQRISKLVEDMKRKN